MLTRFLSAPARRQALRPWRPLYNSVFRRQKDLRRFPANSEQLRTMYGRGVFMFSFGRCGTTVFSDFLNTHPEVITFGEVLNENSYYSFFQDFSRRTLRWWAFRPDLMEAEFYAYLARMVDGSPDMRCLFDLKLESLHMVEGNWRMPDAEFGIFDALQDSDAPVILVERRDLVARHLSGKLAAARKAYHSYHKTRDQAVAPFKVDIARMEHQNAVIRAQIAYVKERFASYPRFEVVAYEDMFEPDLDHPDGGTRFRADLATRMARLLDLEDRFERRPQLQRMSGGRETELIFNMAEVEAARARQPDFATRAPASVHSG